jgi:hypothetical protein
MTTSDLLGSLRHRLESSRARRAVRQSILRIGGYLPRGAVPTLRVVLGYLELGFRHGTPPAYADREALFASSISLITGNRPLYVEFGVYRGRSLRWWSTHLRQPGARLVGFDSFEGLPADWRPDLPAGKFRVAGPPDIDDPRLSFEVGWFEDTLSDFTVPDHDQLIINVDCDLYSSTVTVLEWAEAHIRPGTLIYFDELPDHDHELRALNEHLSRSGRDIEALGIAGGGLHWLFRYRS